jgi:hypothetical protein
MKKVLRGIAVNQQFKFNEIFAAQNAARARGLLSCTLTTPKAIRLTTISNLLEKQTSDLGL